MTISWSNKPVCGPYVVNSEYAPKKDQAYMKTP